MKKVFVLGLLIFGLIGIVSAQSGRRVRTTTPTPASTPAPQPDTTAGSTAVEDSAGGVYTWDKYSESSPNMARSIYDSPLRNDKKSKKEKKEEPKTDPAAAKTTDTAGNDDVLKVETNLVSIPVSVYTRNGNYIPDLSKGNFKIFEEGKEQEVAYFGTTEKPFTVILLIDVSPSTAYKIEQIQQAATTFVDQLKPQDSVMVIQFDERVSVLTELTNDRDKIYKAIRKTGFGSGTSLYEAVDFSIRKRLNKVQGRKAIVLFTDGVDTTSSGSSFESTVSEAEEGDAVIFPVYFNTFLTSMGIGGNGPMSSTPILGLPGGMGGGNTGGSSAEYARGRAYLESLAGVTGGRVYKPEANPTGLNTALEGIADELRQQYSIGYYPKEEGQNGERRQIRVRVNRPNLVVRARDSYIVGATGQTQGSK